MNPSVRPYADPTVTAIDGAANRVDTNHWSAMRWAPDVGHAPREQSVRCQMCGTRTWEYHAVCTTCGPETCAVCAAPDGPSLRGQAHEQYAAALAALHELFTVDLLPAPVLATIGSHTGRPSITVTVRDDVDRDAWARNLTACGYSPATGTSVGTVSHRDHTFVVTVTTAGAR